MPSGGSIGVKSHSGRVSLIISIIRDVTTLALIGLFLLCLHIFAQPFKRGFHCDDETIRYPFKDSTVPSSVLHLVGILVNVSFISLFEYLNIKSQTKINGPKNKRQNQQSSNENNDDRKSKFDYFTFWLCVYCHLIVFGFGAIVSELLTEISKYSAGRLRPHFLEVCHPVMSVSGLDYESYCNSLKEKPPSMSYKYVIDYKCSGDPGRERDTRLSFMSGHSSYAAYTAAFAVIYLQYAMSSKVFGLTKPALQALLVALAFYTGLSRVSDYKHHWQDVLAGLTQGTLTAIVVTQFVWPNFVRLYQQYMNSKATCCLNSPSNVSVVDFQSPENQMTTMPPPSRSSSSGRHSSSSRHGHGHAHSQDRQVGDEQVY